MKEKTKKRIEYMRVNQVRQHKYLGAVDCPKCGKRGSIQLQWLHNKQTDTDTGFHYYVVHSHSKNCYLPKTTPIRLKCPYKGTQHLDCTRSVECHRLKKAKMPEIAAEYLEGKTNLKDIIAREEKTLQQEFCPHISINAGSVFLHIKIKRPVKPIGERLFRKATKELYKSGLGVINYARHPSKFEVEELLELIKEQKKDLRTAPSRPYKWKITDEAVVKLWAAGFSDRRIARELGVHGSSAHLRRHLLNLYTITPGGRKHVTPEEAIQTYRECARHFHEIIRNDPERAQLYAEKHEKWKRSERGKRFIRASKKRYRDRHHEDQLDRERRFRKSTYTQHCKYIATIACPECGERGSLYIQWFHNIKTNTNCRIHWSVLHHKQRNFVHTATRHYIEPPFDEYIEDS